MYLLLILKVIFVSFTFGEDDSQIFENSNDCNICCKYPARVVYTPSVQIFQLGSEGKIQCYIDAVPPIVYVTWTKDKVFLDPDTLKDMEIITNGSLLIKQVKKKHEGRYKCTPYSTEGTQGSSGEMQVLVTESTIPENNEEIEDIQKILLAVNKTKKQCITQKLKKPTPGQKPGHPRNVGIKQTNGDYLISWLHPLEGPENVEYYSIKFRRTRPDFGPWKTLNHDQISPKSTTYLVKNLVGGRTYYFRVYAHSGPEYESSDTVTLEVPSRSLPEFSLK